MFANFERHIDKHGECKFILAGESGKFNEERISGHLPMSPRFLHTIDNLPSASGNTKTIAICIH